LFDPALRYEVRVLVNAVKTIADALSPKGAYLVDLSYLKERLSSNPTRAEEPVKGPWLPEIPLSTFDGDCRYWPSFHDRFITVLSQWPHLSDFDKSYYLIGSLKGSAADAVRGISVFADNYNLLRSTLTTRFHRPRSFIDKMLSAPSFAQETHPDLNNFVSVFNESMSLLTAFKIPDFGSFILFTIAFRCLPVYTCKMFESSVNVHYPPVQQLLDFVQSRAAVLELAGETRKTGGVSNASKSGQATGQARKGGERHSKVEGPRPTSLVTSKSTNSACQCCAGPHSLTTCARFKSWSIDAHAQ